MDIVKLLSFTLDFTFSPSIMYTYILQYDIYHLATRKKPITVLTLEK